MTAPCLYYQGDGVELWHGDARECDAWLAADVLVTDPPYGIAWTKGVWRRPDGSARSAHAGIRNDGDTAARDDVLAAWGDRPAVVFGSLYAPAPAALRHVCVWEKPADAGIIGSTTGYRRDVEALYLCGKWPKRAAAWGSVLRTAAAMVSGMHSQAARHGHPHAKPVDLLCTLIDRAPAGMIADPFAGSGSTLVAARMCGRRAVGVEIEERYCEVAARRLDQGVLFGEAAA
jgi:site-specific DNA-methyltransferase (adenine-specific)